MTIHHVAVGEGVQVLALHGWTPDHRLMTGCLEPIFTDLPGGVDPNEVDDDLVRDVTEILTSLCARLYGRRAAANRAARAVNALREPQ